MACCGPPTQLGCSYHCESRSQCFSGPLRTSGSPSTSSRWPLWPDSADAHRRNESARRVQCKVWQSENAENLRAQPPCPLPQSVGKPKPRASPWVPAKQGHHEEGLSGPRGSSPCSDAVVAIMNTLREQLKQQVRSGGGCSKANASTRRRGHSREQAPSHVCSWVPRPSPGPGST